MQTKEKCTAKIISIQDEEEIGFVSLPEKIYRPFLKSIDPTRKTTFRKRKQITLSEDILTTTKKIVSPLPNRGKPVTLLLIIEALSQNFSLRKYDIICSCLTNAITHKNFLQPFCILIVIPDSHLFNQSILLDRFLVRECNKRKIGLILLSNIRNSKPILLVRGKLPKDLHHTFLDSLHAPRRNDIQFAKPYFSNKKIRENLLSLFGHFQIKIGDKHFHVPTILSVKMLARNAEFIDILYDEAIKLIGNEDFVIRPVGIPLGGINELAASLIQKNSKRMCSLEEIDTLTNCSVILLCDYLSNIYSIDKAVKECLESGVRNVGILGIGKYKEFKKIDDVKIKYFLDMNFTSSTGSYDDCGYCIQKIPIIEGENFKDFEIAIKEFDSFTFWEFIKQDSKFFKVGHWPSDRTANHYHFRIITGPIFKYHCYDLSIRVRNILKSMNIIPEWIKKIVCTGGEESNIFSLGLAEAFKLSSEDIIQIPREYFKYIAGKNIDETLIDYINKLYGDHSLKDKNVLIVNQAAHHLKTFSALRTVCEFYNCSIMGFTVFVDRTMPEVSLGEYLYDSHYVPLYSWPSQPRLEHQCPCMQIGKNEGLE